MLQIFINLKAGNVSALGAAALFLMFSFVGQAAAAPLDQLRAGEKAVRSGQYAAAIKRIDKAMQGDTLTQEQMAQALYLRGVAYNGTGEPARSIADLTKAIFFKKISPELKARILVERAKAYRAVGLSSRAEKDLRRAGAGANRIDSIRTPAAPVKRADNGVTRRRSAPIEVIKVKPRRPQPRQQQQTAVTSGWGASVQSEPVRRKQVTQQPRRPVARKTPQNQYKRMFDDTPQQQPSRRTASNNQGGLRSAQWKQADRNVNSRRISHTQSTGRSSFNAPRSGSGRYRLQLAAVSSENDAEQAWQRLVSRHASLLNGQSPDFQKVNLGNQKSVIRIQIGPFSDKLETLQLCNKFKENGLDCFLVVR